MIKPINTKATYAGLTILLIGIILSIQLGYSVFYGLLLGNTAIYIIAFWHGYTHKQIIHMMVHGIKSAWIVLLMMALIGVIIGLWMISGTIPTMMYIGFQYLSRINFVLASFFIASMISMVLGTSLGTISTVGMALVGIGKGLGVPLPLLIGSIISGAYMGDRSSPISSSANLTAVITQTKLIENLKHMVATIVPIYGICTLFYFWIGQSYMVKNALSPEIIRLQSLLSSHFLISWNTLIPPLIIIITMAVFKLPMIQSLSAGLLASLVLMIFQENFSIHDIVYTIIYGFHPVKQEIASILSGGGLLSMKSVLLIITVSTALNGILDDTGMIEPLIQKFIARIKSVGSLILRTSFLSFMIATVTCNQTLAIIIPGKFLQKFFEKNHVSKNTLARTIADTGIVLVPLIPWNVNAIVITAIFGVSVFQYGPYSLLCYLTPMITIFYGYMGFVKKSTVQQHHT